MGWDMELHPSHTQTKMPLLHLNKRRGWGDTLPASVKSGPCPPPKPPSGHPSLWALHGSDLARILPSARILLGPFHQNPTPPPPLLVVPLHFPFMDSLPPWLCPLSSMMYMESYLRSSPLRSLPFIAFTTLWLSSGFLFSYQPYIHKPL